VTDKHNTKYNTLISEQPYIHARWSIFTFPGQNEPRPGHWTPWVNSGTITAIPGRLATLGFLFSLVSLKALSWDPCFSCYISDIETDVTSEIRLFADDCILYWTIKSSADCLVLQSDISKLQSWACTWQMHFNSDKCHMLLISRKHNETLPSYHQ